MQMQKEVISRVTVYFPCIFEDTAILTISESLSPEVEPMFVNEILQDRLIDTYEYLHTAHDKLIP